MRPIDFVLYDGDSAPNTAVITLFNALHKPIIINSFNKQFEVMSYYLTSDGMVLDIAPIETE